MQSTNKRVITYSLIASCIASITGLSATHAQARLPSQNQFIQSYSNVSNIKKQHIPLIHRAEKESTPAGQAVLRQARIMSLNQRKIIRGSCWDYLNKVFNNAGFPQKQRKTVFTAKKDGGNYYDINKLQAGDWIYHTNLSYRNGPHSGMFIGWLNKAKSQALMLSYAGEGRKEPARYKVYDVSRIYNVMRPIDNNVSKARYKRSQQAQTEQLRTKQLQAKAKAKKSKAYLPNNSYKPYNESYNKPYSEPYNEPSNKANNQLNSQQGFVRQYANAKNVNYRYLPILFKAEKYASRAGKTVLQQARQMTLDNPEIVVGTSRNYVQSLFNRVGARYNNIFDGSYNGSRFFDPQRVQAGDWLSYINHSYNDSEHTGIFVGWINQSQNKAVILSYGGEYRKHPARYRVYDISHIYGVKRPVV